MVTIAIIVAFVFAVVCVCLLLFLPRFEFIEMSDQLFPPHDTGRLLTLNLKFESSYRPRTPIHHRRLTVFIAPPDEQKPAFELGSCNNHHSAGARGRKGEVGGSRGNRCECLWCGDFVFLCWSQVWTRDWRSYNKHLFFFKHFFVFFLVSIVPLLLTGKGTRYMILDLLSFHASQC